MSPSKVNLWVLRGGGVVVEIPYCTERSGLFYIKVAVCGEYTRRRKWKQMLPCRVETLVTITAVGKSE